MTNGVTISPVNMTDRAALGIKAGDTVRVHQKIQDKGKMRIQVFEGLVLARKHGTEAGATFTVRKVVDGIGVEKIYPLYSPLIDKIEITRRSKVRRAKLYHIREKVAREAKRQMRRMFMTSLSTESGIEMAAKAAAEEAERKAREEAEAAAAAAAQAEKEAAAAKAAEEAAAAPVAEETPATETPTDKADDALASEGSETPAEEKKDEAAA